MNYLAASALPDGVLDRVIIPLALLFGGLLVARLLAGAVRRGCRRVGERSLTSMQEALSGIGIGEPIPDLAARVAFWVTALLVVTQAANQAQLGLLTSLLDGAIRITPLLGVGLGIMFAGAIAGDRIGRIIGVIAERSGAMPGRLAEVIVRAATVAGASIIAFDTMGLATILPVTVVSLLVAALLALVAAAAVLASRGLLSNIAAARYVEETFIEGDRVLFRQVPAQVQSIGLLSTELLTESGATLHVPNHILLDEAA